MKNVDVVIPIYRNLEQIRNLYSQLILQEDINIKNVVFPFTLSETDEDEKIRQFLNEEKITYFEVKKSVYFSRDKTFYHNIVFFLFF